MISGRVQNLPEAPISQKSGSSNASTHAMDDRTRGVSSAISDSMTCSISSASTVRSLPDRPVVDRARGDADIA